MYKNNKQPNNNVKRDIESRVGSRIVEGKKFSAIKQTTHQTLLIQFLKMSLHSSSSKENNFITGIAKKKFSFTPRYRRGIKHYGLKVVKTIVKLVLFNTHGKTRWTGY